MERREEQNVTVDKKTNDKDQLVTITKSDLIGLGVIAGIGVALLFGIRANIKMGRVSDKLGIAVRDLKSKSSVHVSQAIIEKATREAADEAVSVAVRRAADEATANIRADVSRQVREAVQNRYSEITKEVGKELRKQVERIDIHDFREEIKDEAKDLIMEKLKDDMDTILDSYNNQLENVGAIYSSIADKFKEK